MLDRDLDFGLEATAPETVHTTRDWQLLALLAACGFVAGVIAGVVAAFRQETGVLSVITAIATVAATLLVAVALVRLVDAMVLRRWLSLRADNIASMNAKTRRILQSRNPEVAARAARLDAGELLDRALAWNPQSLRPGDDQHVHRHRGPACPAKVPA